MGFSTQLPGSGFVPRNESYFCKRQSNRFSIVFKTLPGESPMGKIAPLIGLSVATFFAFRVAMNLQNPLGESPKTPAQTSLATPRADSAHWDQHSIEPAYKAVIRCLSDMDDLLDTIHDPASFAAVKPKLLSRAKQHAAQASEYANQGLTQLSRPAAIEMQQAANRHTEALARAIQVAPAVAGFFATDIANTLTAK
jgi:hypothetical protein